MCQSMVNIQSPTLRLGEEKKEKRRRRNSMKIYMVSLLHRATIKKKAKTNNMLTMGRGERRGEDSEAESYATNNLHNCSLAVH